MRMIKRAAYLFGIVNLVIGVLSLVGPLTTNNRGQIITRRPGRFLGLIANNWLHALDHLMAGALGIVLSARAHTARYYMLGMGIGYGLMAVLGWNTVGTRPGIYRMLGFAIDRNANILHTVWALIGFGFALRDSSFRMGDVTETLRELSNAEADVIVPQREKVL